MNKENKLLGWVIFGGFLVSCCAIESLLLSNASGEIVDYLAPAALALLAGIGVHRAIGNLSDE